MVSRHALLGVLLTSVSVFLGAYGAKVTVSVPASAPSDAPVVSRSLISFSIEQDRWTDWAGNTSRNQFFYNILDNVKQITGIPPFVRVGADSEDHTDFSFNVEVSACALGY